MKVRTMGVLSAAHFVNDFYSIVLAIFIPVLVSQLGIDYLRAGILVSSVAIIGTSLQAPVGYWADRYQKRITFISMGFIAYGFGSLVIGLSVGFGLLLVAAVLIGLGGTTYHPQSATLITKQFSRKGQALGIHGAAGQLGRFIAPIVIAYLISQTGWRLAAGIVLVPGVIAAILCKLTLREPAERAERGFAGAVFPFLVFLVLIFGLRAAVFQGVVSFLPSFFVASGSSLNIAGLLTGVTMAVGLVAQPFGGFMGDRFSKGKILLIGLAGLTILLPLLYLALSSSPGEGSFNYPALIAILIGIGFCVFMTFPIGLALPAELARGERIGASVGLIAGGAMIFPAVTLPGTGYVIDRYGFGAGFLLLSLFAAAGTFACALYVYLEGRSKGDRRGTDR